MNNDLTAEEWGKRFNPPISLRRVQFYCKKERVSGAYTKGGMYWIPKGAPDPRRPEGKAGHEDYYKKQKREAS